MSSAHRVARVLGKGQQKDKQKKTAGNWQHDLFSPPCTSMGTYQRDESSLSSKHCDLHGEVIITECIKLFLMRGLMSFVLEYGVNMLCCLTRLLLS